MTSKLFQDLMESCTTDSPLFPPTLLYNEGWLLRIILAWYSSHEVKDHALFFSEGARWFSEASLPSAFLPRFKGDRLAESHTHLDGVMGHFVIGKTGKTDLSLLPDATQFVALEAKIFSELSYGVKKARYYDQAARNVACITEVLRRANRHPGELQKLGFYVLAPQSQIEKKVFTRLMSRKSIRQKVERRVKEYVGDKDQWYSEWFQPTFQYIKIRSISWEELIEKITEQDGESGESIDGFYQRCLEFNL